MNASPGGLAERSKTVARRLMEGRTRYLVLAALVAAWLAVAVIVALATASGVVWF
jgi:hypothetical protein